VLLPQVRKLADELTVWHQVTNIPWQAAHLLDSYTLFVMNFLVTHFIVPFSYMADLLQGTIFCDRLFAHENVPIALRICRTYKKWHTFVYFRRSCPYLMSPTNLYWACKEIAEPEVYRLPWFLLKYMWIDLLHQFGLFGSTGWCMKLNMV
jgi:hypothetical protein